VISLSGKLIMILGYCVKVWIGKSIGIQLRKREGDEGVYVCEFDFEV
jgi:hypothetical protein